MTHIIQQGVIHGLPDVAHGPLHVPGGDDFVGPRCVFVGGEDPDLSSGNFFFMNVHSLSEIYKSKYVIPRCIYCFKLCMNDKKKKIIYFFYVWILIKRDLISIPRHLFVKRGSRTNIFG